MTSQSIIQGIVLLLYLVAMIMVGFVFYKKNTTRRLHTGRQGTEYMGNVNERAGFRYERLAAYGSAGNSVSAGSGHDRSGMDGYRTCNRYISELAYCGEAAS